jgi:hypothetical protein
MWFGRFHRAIGAVVLGVAGASAGALWLALSWDHPTAAKASRGVSLGAWRLVYDTEAPTVRLLLGAVAIALLAAAGITLLERRTTDRARRSANTVATPLAAKVVMAATEGVYAGPVTVTVLIPAHNEEASLPATLRSLRSQSHRPERVVVVADNCTDRTVALARRAGVEVVESVDNTDKKAGALNQALRVLLPDLGDNDVVMVMDADTVLDDGFLEAAVRRSGSSSATSTSATRATCGAAAAGSSCSPAPRRCSGRGRCVPSPRAAATRSPAGTATCTTPPPSPRTTSSPSRSSRWALSWSRRPSAPWSPR